MTIMTKTAYKSLFFVRVFLYSMVKSISEMNGGIMMKAIRVNAQYVDDNYKRSIDSLTNKIKDAHDAIRSKSGAGSDFLGWHTLPQEMDERVVKINKTAERLKKHSDILLVIGIGGSYLGSQAVITALDGYFNDKDMEIIFVGHHLSAAYIASLKRYLDDKSFSINVISKSGTTTEPAVAFRIFRTMLEEKLGKAEAAKRIVATTDASKGALRNLADQEGYETYVVDDNVGGRYSVFTPVGLLPIACAGHNIELLLAGAKDMLEASEVGDTDDIYTYVALRHALYESGKKIEMFVHYEPSLQYVAEWWKQLFGESEGKENRGLFPASAGFTTDLHSLGQYIQEGERHVFETVVSIKEPLSNLKIESDKDNLDGLNYLEGQSIDYVNKQAMQGTLLAHQDGGAPSIVIELTRLDAYHLGSLLYFYELACALSGYVLEVNPFNQPGVEAYKKNMFALLEKPGFEAATKAIKKRLK
jgi:glucose-6-phosphate isomerase